jgi:hypothetical protein
VREGQQPNKGAVRCIARGICLVHYLGKREGQRFPISLNYIRSD